MDPAGNLPHDQLSKMFPTPPSHEHAHEHHHDGHQMTSPADCGGMDLDSVHSGQNGPYSPADPMEWSSKDDPNSLCPSMFSALPRLWSEDLPPLHVPPDLHYKPRLVHNLPSGSHQPQSAGGHGQHGHGQGHVGLNPASSSTPVGTPAPRHGMSPISPMPNAADREGGPRSHHGPGSVGNYTALASPASVSSNYLNKSISSVDPATASSGAGTASAAAAAAAPKVPEANSLVLNLVLYDTMLNVFRDHNFNSCTLCVCNNEGNIKGGDAGSYLPAEFTGDEDVSCSCGYSAVINRRMAYQSGLFYEDETEVTSITEDLYYRKKPSLLLLDPKASSEGNEQSFNERAAEVDRIPQPLLEQIHKQSTFYLSPHNALIKYSRSYLKNYHHVHAPNGGMNMVELMDSNEVIFTAVDQVRGGGGAAANTAKLEEGAKNSCLHKWCLLPTGGPLCSEDVIRVMRALQPALQSSLHTKKTATSGGSTAAMSSVTGPMTWRQFHRMAGPSTKGNTDDQCEPLPVPTVTVGH